MKVLLAFALLVGGVAHAQPGAGAPPPPPTYPQPYPPPPQQYQPGYGYAVGLTAEEHELLMQGEISDGARVGGGLAAFFLGFGSGQAIQGRWSDTGWIFTLGDTASTVAFAAGLVRLFDDCLDPFGNQVDCDHSDGPPLIVVGLLGALVFRTWEVIDAFSGPGEHNRRVRDLKFRMGVPVRVGVQPYVNKTHDGGATAGLTLSF